MKTVVEQVG